MIEEIKPAPAWANIAASITRRMPLGKHRLIQSLFGNSNKRFLARMASELGGYQFDCCFRDRVARAVFFVGCHAIQEIAFVRDVLRPGMTFVDVGANWGLFTLTAAHLVGASGRVVALEPDPRIFTKLQSNVERNQLSQVTALNIAAADGDAMLTLAGHDHATEDWETSRLVQEASVGQLTFQVQARRVDAVLDEAGLKSIDLLKMDVEGAEDLALAGMEQGLSSHRYRCLMLELHPPQLAGRGKAESQVLNTLKAHGYRGYFLDYTAAAIRRIYYHPWLHCSDLLSLEQGLAHHLRHTIWLSPDQPDVRFSKE